MTHWKKNMTSKFISGEDLFFELDGLKKEMIVKVIKLDDTETYDQNANENITKSAIFLADENGKPLPKPVILNKTNAVFFEKETGTPEMEDWAGKTVVLYAKPDVRFGHVVRFKKHYPKNTADGSAPIFALKGSRSAEELKAVWNKLTSDEQKLPAVLKLKNELKLKFEKAK